MAQNGQTVVAKAVFHNCKRRGVRGRIEERTGEEEERSVLVQTVHVLCLYDVLVHVVTPDGVILYNGAVLYCCERVVA